MIYGILTNPAAGNYSIRRKLEITADVMEALGGKCNSPGPWSRNREEFCETSAKLSRECDVLVVFGGDGTLLDVINSADPQTPLAFYPLGSGNSIAHALGIPSEIKEFGNRIRAASKSPKSLDLILCDNGYKAIFASVGIEAPVLQLRERYKAQGLSPFHGYAKALVRGLMDYKRTDALISDWKSDYNVPNMLTAIVTKIPFYGFGMNLVPKASPFDGKLHVLASNSHLPMIALGILESFTIGNRVGTYISADKLIIKASSYQQLQMNGTNYDKKATEFKFSVLPGELKMVY